MDCPIPAEPADMPQIRRAFRVARRMRWLPALVGAVCAPIVYLIGSITTWYVGLGVFVILEAVVMAVGYSAARCPKCGQVWGIGMVWWAGYNGATELKTLVCRRCRTDIRFALRE